MARDPRPDDTHPGGQLTDSPAGPLAGMTAVVTGASSGIGRATALELGAAGADVLVHARRSQQRADEVAAQLTDTGRRSRVCLLDLAEKAKHEWFVDQAWAWKGRVDIWVNNAGADVLTGASRTWSFDEKLQELWNVDVLGTIRLSRLSGQRMKASGGGVIVNIGWDQADQGMPGDSGEMFAATKGAIAAFSKSLAQALAPEVRVNCIAPGWIKTAWGNHASEYWQQRAPNDSLLRRWGAPEDVARVARFLVSPDASFINGQVVPVNGGWRRS